MESIDQNIEVTGQQIIKRLRDIVQPPGKKGLWLRLLSDRQLAEVYHRLKRGQTAYHVSKICQDDWRIQRDSSIQSLSRGMLRFRDAILGDIQKDAVKSEEGKKEFAARKKRGSAIVNKLDGLGRLRWLIERQTDRIQALLDREQSAIPFQMTDKSIKVLGELIEQYLRLQMELGLIDSKPEEFNLNIEHKFKAILTGMQFTDDGHRLAIAANKFLEMASEASIIMEPEADGTYSAEGTDG
jgi:hypothetical protein